MSSVGGGSRQLWDIRLQPGSLACILTYAKMGGQRAVKAKCLSPQGESFLPLTEPIMWPPNLQKTPSISLCIFITMSAYLCYSLALVPHLIQNWFALRILCCWFSICNRYWKSWGLHDYNIPYTINSIPLRVGGITIHKHVPWRNCTGLVPSEFLSQVRYFPIFEKLSAVLYRRSFWVFVLKKAVHRYFEGNFQCMNCMHGQREGNEAEQGIIMGVGAPFAFVCYWTNFAGFSFRGNNENEQIVRKSRAEKCYRMDGGTLPTKLLFGDVRSSSLSGSVLKKAENTCSTMAIWVPSNRAPHP